MKDKDAVFMIQAGLGDYSVCAIEWSLSGEDLILKLSPPSDDDELVQFKFVWAHEVTVNLAFGNYFGQPLIFSSSATERTSPDVGWSVTIAFGAQPEGKVSLCCNSNQIA